MFGQKSAVALGALALMGVVSAVDDSDIRPQYLYGQEIPVTCLERNMYVSPIFNYLVLPTPPSQHQVP